MKKAIIVLVFLLSSCTRSGNGVPFHIVYTPPENIFLSNQTVSFTGDVLYFPESYINPHEITMEEESGKVEAPGNFRTIDFSTLNTRPETTIKGTFFFRIRFCNQNKSLLLRVPYLTNADIFVNGDLKHEIRSIEQYFLDGSLLYRDSYLVLDSTGCTTDIVIHNYSDNVQNSGGLFSIGNPASVITDISRQKYLLIAVITILLVLCVYHMNMFVLYPNDRSLVTFAVICLVIGARLAILNVSISTDSFVILLLSRLYYSLYYLVSIFFIFFVSHNFPKALSSFFVSISASILAIFAGTLFFVHDSFISVYIISTYYIISFISAHIIYRILVSNKKKMSLSSKVFVVCFLVFVFANINDLLAASGISPLHGTLKYAIVLLITSEVFLISYRYTKSHLAKERIAAELADKTEQLTLANSKLLTLNKNLEHTVEIKTDEYKHALLRAEEALGQLESTHELLEKDLELAGNIQRSYFPNMAPECSGWQISFIYHPAHRVSGDMYDFYTRNNNLAGVSLFDVSGHGIASGLITMLSKNIVSDIFYRYYDRSFEKTISFINRRLIHEIGELDNYLTGVMLRFKKDIVEYSNASHADVLLKRPGETARSLAGNDFKKGNFLGVPVLNEYYATTSVTLIPGDTLYIFSDCLFESHIEPEKGGKRESFGIFRIQEIINEMGDDKSAEELLSEITGRFFLSLGNNPLSDDLTLIVLKKTE